MGFIVAIFVLKLLLSTIEPPSFDLGNIISLVHSPGVSIGPWIGLYPPLYIQSAVNSTLLQQWLLAPPIGMNPNFEIIALYFRLPILLLDLATCFVLVLAGKVMGCEGGGRMAALIWFANPYTFFGSELSGTPDILATIMLVISVTLLVQKRYFLSTISLALGIWVKFFPFLVVPAFLMFQYQSKSPKKAMATTLSGGLLGLAGYFSWALPNWHQYLTTYTPVAQPFPFVAGPVAINNSAFVLLLFYFAFMIFAKHTKSLTILLLPTLLVYYAVSNPASQYLIWAMPLMALDLAIVGRSRAALFAIFYGLGFANWFFVSSAFLTPSGYSLLMIPLSGDNLPSYSQAITQLLDNSAIINLIQPFISSAMFACIIAYAIDVVRCWFVKTQENGIAVASVQE